MGTALVDPFAIPTAQIRPAALAAACLGLRTDGRSIAQAGTDLAAAWQGLAAVYHAPEAPDLCAAMQPATTRAVAFGAELAQVERALADFSARATPIARQLAAAKADAEDFYYHTASPHPDWAQHDDLVARNTDILHRVDTAVLAYQAAERDCANAIEDAAGTGRWWRAAYPSGPAALDSPDVYGLTSLPAGAAPWGAPVTKHKSCARSSWDAVGSFFSWHRDAPGPANDWVGGYSMTGLDQVSAGVDQAATATAAGVGALAGIDGWQRFRAAWDGLATLVGAHGASAAGDAWDEAGKGLLDWDQWGSDPGKAAGYTLFNALTFLIPGGKLGKAAGDLARLEKSLARIRGLDPDATTLLPRVLDVANNLRAKLAATGDPAYTGAIHQLDQILHDTGHTPEPIPATTHAGGDGAATVDHPGGQDTPFQHDTTDTSSHADGTPAHVDSHGVWHWKGLELTPEQNHIADAALHDRAIAYHHITEHLRQITHQLAGTGHVDHIRLVGPDEGTSLKAADRFKEKLAKLIIDHPDDSPTTLAAGIHDGIRYTYELDFKGYTHGVDELTHQLEHAGYNMRVRTNSWIDEYKDYQGINSTWRDPHSGQLFELQFHTPDSLTAKEATHGTYEIIENPQTSAAEREQLMEEQRRIFQTVPVPSGVDTIENIFNRG